MSRSAVGASASINTYTTKSDFLVALLPPTKEHCPRCFVLYPQPRVAATRGAQTVYTIKTRQAIKRDHKSHPTSHVHQPRLLWLLALGRRTALFDGVHIGHDLKWTAENETNVSRNAVSASAGVNTYTTKSNTLTVILIWLCKCWCWLIR